MKSLEVHAGEIVCRPIGFLRSCYSQKFATPRQSGLVKSSWAELRLEKFVQPELSLDDVEGFSHLWLISGFHGNTNRNYHAKIQTPRDSAKKRGVYATRSPHRWNPLGLSLVRLEKRKEDTLYLSGIDLIDQTPIYDIKPYLAQVESVSDARSGWLEEKDFPQLDVTFSESLADAALEETTRQLVTETLSYDPRSQADWQVGKKDFVATIGEQQVYFTFLSPTKIEVTRVESVDSR